MKTDNHSYSIELKPQDNQRLASLCGACDEHIRQIEQHFNVIVNHRNYLFNIQGEPTAIKRAGNAIESLYQQTVNNFVLTPEQIYLRLQDDTMHDGTSAQTVTLKTKRGLIKASGHNQAIYLKNIMSHDINFAIGPAGTGKTYLAVACAVSALEKEQVQRILLIRPAVEAGEKLGFLPGDLSQKVSPYLRPLYDALHEMMGFEYVNRLIENEIIEIAPLAYMRGRTLNDSFVILDEGQNCTIEQMKMFLTRIGFGSKAVITGDLTQIDLPKHIMSGLKHARATLEHIKGISFTTFTAKDAVRHPLVQAIIEAYEQHK
ncbi:MAG: PhoH family protein [Gammaproteobacteria bacterium]